MRLQELYIKDYKVLQDFTLRFDEATSVAVLIGENGSGKTTVVECLTLIFTGLYRQRTVADLYKAAFPFAFRLSYVLSTGPQVGFGYEQENRESIQYTYNGSLAVQFTYDEGVSVLVRADDGRTHETSDQLSTFLQDEGYTVRPVQYLLPANVVLYYSGISTVLESLTDAYQQAMIMGTLDGELQTNPDLFYFKPANFPALLVGLLCFQYGNVPERLATDFQLDPTQPFERVTIQIKKPTWAKKSSNAQGFWGAAGDLRNFLKVLRDRTEATFEENAITFTIQNQAQLYEVWSFYGQEKRLFEYLVTLQANGLIERIDVDLRKSGGLIVPHDRLSEGEKQLLIIMALQELLATGENTLFLLDEPDTYLHPEWKRNFIARFLPDDPNVSLFLAYYLITTHSPGIVSGMRKNQLHILRKESRRSVLKTFAFDPYGKPEDDILFDFFGITGLRYKPVEDKLNELGRLINEDQYESDDFLSRFAELEQMLGKDDLGLTRLKLEIARRKRAA